MSPQRWLTIFLFINYFTLGSGYVLSLLGMTVGGGAYPAMLGVFFIKIGFLSFILSGAHSGYRIKTIHSVPEFEEILEVLDVPEDEYLRRTQKDKQMKQKEFQKRIQIESRKAEEERIRRRVWKALFGRRTYPADMKKPALIPADPYLDDEDDAELDNDVVQK